jgi:hypothetical protein
VKDGKGMKFNMLFISATVLFCLTVQIFPLIYIASADGCGINPLGDTSGDTDFYVSKNQNLPASSGLPPAIAPSNEVSTASSLSTSGEQMKKNVTLESLNPDKASPQVAGSAIVWMANATAPGDEELLYDFFLKGPATGGELIEKTGWGAENSWTWNTSEADIGQNQVQVQVKRLGAGGVEGLKSQNYTISAPASEKQVTDSSTSIEKPKPAELNPHPGGKTANIDVSKPRLAPDERGAAAAGGLPDETRSIQDPLSASSDDMDVGGKWSVELAGSGCTLDIKNLIQTGDSIVGMGDLIERNIKIPQTIRGTVTSNSLRLRSKAVIDKFGNDIDKSVSLYLEKEGWSFQGRYELYSGNELTGKGNATASRFTN